MTSPAFQTALQAIPDVTGAELAVAAAMQYADALRTASVTTDTQLRTAIGTRVAALQAAVTTATADQVTATTAATSETASAAAVKASTPATTLAYVTLIRDQIAALHTTLADLEAWRAQMDSGYALATTATADLATVVATKL